MSGGSRKKGGAGSPSPRRRRPSSREVLYGSLSEDPAVAFDADSFSPRFGDFVVDQTLAGRFAAALEELARVGDPMEGEGAYRLGRVVRLDRGYPLVLTEDGATRAEHAVEIAKAGLDGCAVGDWVVLRMPQGHDRAVVRRVLERGAVLSRWDGGSRGERQVLAANIDLLVVVQPLSSRDVLCDRVVRSLVIAAQGGMGAAVVLTKSDRCPDADHLAGQVRRVREAVADLVPVLAVSSESGEGVEDVRSLVRPRTSAVLLGESGAGKSTLINALIGSDVLACGAVRDKDDQGRHTTVARRMLAIPGAGVLVDAPGLRSIPLLDEDKGLAAVFPEIELRSAGCRFRDCTHGSEPGCAVRADAGAGVDPARLESYRALAAEMTSNRKRLSLSAKSSITR